MKICFLGLDNLPVLAREFGHHAVGGEQVQQTLLARAMQQRGLTVSMAVFDYGQDDGAAWDGIATHRTYGEQAGLPVLRFVYPRWWHMWRAMRRADADVYYVSCAGMQLGLAAMFCRRHGRRLVFRVAHDSDCEPGQLLIKYWRDKKLYAYGLRRADAILVQTARQQARLYSNYGRASRIAEMLVDPPGPEQARTVDILWVNNIRGFKRPDLFLALARSMPARRLRMIGGTQPGSEALYHDIAREAQEIPNLEFLGRVPYHDMDRHYAQAKVFVNTSDSEGFPNSYLQSWIRGTPVVAFFDPDGVIRREQLGRAAASLDDMRAHLCTLLDDGAAWQAASRRCRGFMHERFGDERILAPYLDTLKEIAP
jgi:glycosyltransferase involved in cell wall biosynthesis